MTIITVTDRELDLENRVAELEAELAALKNQEPVAYRKATKDGFYRYYEAAEIHPELCEPLYLAAGAKEKTE